MALQRKLAHTTHYGSRYKPCLWVQHALRVGVLLQEMVSESHKKPHEGEPSGTNK